MPGTVAATSPRRLLQRLYAGISSRTIAHKGFLGILRHDEAEGAPRTRLRTNAAGPDKKLDGVPSTLCRNAG